MPKQAPATPAVATESVHMAQPTAPCVKHAKMGSLNTTSQEISFANETEEKRYFRVGKHKSQVSPCVNLNELQSDYAVVYEEWQSISSNAKHTWFRCRRHGKCRRKNGIRHVGPEGRLREPKTLTEYIYCGCNARYRRTLFPDGTVKIRFRGTHNHDCQRDYAMKFLNPIRACMPIREIVDSKLFAGVRKVQLILTSVLNEMLKRRSNHTTFEQLRTYQMSFALKRSQITNRVRQLGLDPDRLAHK